MGFNCRLGDFDQFINDKSDLKKYILPGENF